MNSLNESPQYYLTAEYPCSYLEGRRARSEVAIPHTYHFDELIRSGFRRSGLFVYRPSCRHCNACIAVRVDVAKFSPDRSQKRSFKRHSTLSVREKALRFDAEHFELYGRYQKARHPGGGMDNDSEEQYRNSLLLSQVDTSLYEFRDSGELRMVSIIDEIGDGLSSVYTFFDPDLPGASLGTYNVLWQIDLCKKLNLPYLYLGYWIEECRKMAYKHNFQPQQGYVGGKWQTMEK